MIILLALIAFGEGCLPHSSNAPQHADVNRYINEYKAQNAIQHAVSLQSMDTDAAIKEMRAMAHMGAMAQIEHGDKSEQIYVLCRMLFVSSNNLSFREPALGSTVYMRGGASDWPLSPVELVDGVPFIVAGGYNLAGQSESPEEYLDYCLANCSWSKFRYHLKTQEQMNEALAKLLKSAKWLPPLNDRERLFLIRQIN